MRAWVNGRLLADPAEAAVSVLDRGFSMGDGAFEAVKVVDGQPFALTRHLRRLAGACRGLGLPELDEDLVRSGVSAVLAAEPLALGRLRITWTAGVAEPGPGRGSGTPTVSVVSSAYAPRGPSEDVVTVPWPRNERSALAGLKATSYAENVLALAYAAERGAGEALFADTRGHLCEGAGSNVFVVVGGDLLTPALSTGCLPGVTRGLLVEWCDVVEVEEPLSVLGRADEIFLASTTRDVQPVRFCDGRDLGEPGPVTRSAQAVWHERAGADLDP